MWREELEVQVIEALADVMLNRGSRKHWLGQRAGVRGRGITEVVGESGTGTLYLEPGSGWENGYCESFNGKLRDECLNGESHPLKEAQVVIEKWRVVYNTLRPHSALGYRPPPPAARAAKGASRIAYGSLRAPLHLYPTRV